MENQQFLMDNIGPMYMQQQAQQQALQAQSVTPDANGNVTLVTGEVPAPAPQAVVEQPLVNEQQFAKPGAP